MFGVEFQTATTLVLLFRVLISVLLLISLWFFGSNLYTELKNPTPNVKRIIFRFGLIPVVLIILLFAISGGAMSPKGTIHLPNRPALPSQEEVVITTPPSRTEYKDGFTPMGQ